MRVVAGDTMNAQATQQEITWERKTYHELADIPVQTDVLEQLHQNLAKLLDLQNRMNFMIKEVRSVMKV